MDVIDPWPPLSDKHVPGMQKALSQHAQDNHHCAMHCFFKVAAGGAGSSSSGPADEAAGSTSAAMQLPIRSAQLSVTR